MAATGFRQRIAPLFRRGLHTYWRLSRGLTLGVRGLVVDGESRVFLVRHGYVAGWHLPGGGVEVGESVVEALRRELREEGNILFDGEPELHGIYFNSHASRRDHVAVFIVRDWRQPTAPAPGREIAATGFFSRDALPEDTTEGTRRRIAELFDNILPSATWR
jgi:ADP-ribose pyrophosphatase YjhB (NUDIX family)